MANICKLNSTAVSYIYIRICRTIYIYGFLSKLFFPKSAIIRGYMGLRFLLLSSASPCPNTCSICKGSVLCSAKVSSTRHIQSLQVGEELATHIMLFWPCGTAGMCSPSASDALYVTVYGIRIGI